MAPQLSPNDRERIIALKLSGHKIADIHRLTGITRHTIYFWLKRWEECGDITAHRRQIYRRATTAPQDADIIAAHMADPNLSTKATSSKYKISVDTVRRRLKEAKSVDPPAHGNYITPLVSINDDGPKREKLNNNIQSCLVRVNNEFLRITHMLSQEIAPSSLTALKRLDKALSAIETPAQAKSFALTKSPNTKKKKKPITRKELGIIKALKAQAMQPGSSGTNATPNAAEDNIKLKRRNTTRKIRNFRTVKELPPPLPAPFTESFFAKYHLAANGTQNYNSSMQL